MSDDDPISTEAIEATVDLVRACEATARAIGMTVAQTVEIQLRTAQAMQEQRVTVLSLAGMKETH